MLFCDEYNKKSLNIALEFKNEMQGRLPQQLTQHCHPSKTVLVVGMNPSFNLEWIANSLNMDNKDAELLFSLDHENIENRLDVIRKFEFKAFNEHPYFKVLKEFLSVLSLQDNWNHLDLFIMRETSQKEALKSIGHREIKEDFLVKTNLNNYGKAQLELFKWAVEELKPKIIIIANTAASVLVSNIFNGGKNETTFDLDIDPNYRTKVFLSGMLGGQRALDRFSRLRLIKEIKEHIIVF